MSEWNQLADLWTDTGTQTVAGTRDTPTAATEGADLRGVTGYTVIISAAAGQTLDGTGTVKMWKYSPGLTRWTRNPSLDFPITDTLVAWANVRDRISLDIPVDVSEGRVLPAISSVGTSSGAVTVQVEAFRRNP